VYPRTILQPDAAGKLTGKLGRADVALLSARDQGRLVDIAPRPVGGQRAYSLIWPEEKAELPALQAFAAWLQAEAAG